jgi:hypothetical protein
MTVHDFDEDVLQRMGSLIEPRLQPGESLADILAGAKFLAIRRAELLGRPVITDIDIEYIFRIFTWWPFKLHPPPPPHLEGQLQETRRLAFAGAADGNTRGLETAVPNSLLLFSAESIHQMQVRGEMHDLLRPPE